MVEYRPAYEFDPLAHEKKGISKHMLIKVSRQGKKIRYRIQSSRQWVEKIEQYMLAMNTSSGLQLSLKWKSRKADSDGQLDTSELVELLDKDYHVLKDGDREKISHHFRSKIDYVRKTSQDESIMASFHQLIRLSTVV